MADRLRLPMLSGNQLKIIAAILMTIDHIGMLLFPQFVILRRIGRLAFPIFAYMIAEGCYYTKNRRKYLLTMAGAALVCQLCYFFIMHSLYQCIFVTFSLSLLVIFAYDDAVKQSDTKSYAVLLIAMLGILFLAMVLPHILKDTDYRIDYGFWGILLPLFAYIGIDKRQKLIYLAAGLILIAADFGGNQWYSLLALPILALYSGKRGILKMKSFFYIYYPLHLVIIYIIDSII